MIPIYDAHNHLHDERLASVLEKLPEIGVRACVVNGTRESDWRAVSELAKRFRWVRPGFGLHPWFVGQRSKDWAGALERFLDAHPNASIGEIGLDRWMENPDVAGQEDVFRRQLEIAAARKLPVTIHCLKAWGQLDATLKKHHGPILLHSYGGSAELAATFAKRGHYFSMSGYFAHDRKSVQREVFKSIPIEQLLVETDAPDMLPPWASGDVNDPANIAGIYDFAAELRGMSREEFAAQMESNFRRLFGS